MNLLFVFALFLLFDAKKQEQSRSAKQSSQ